MEILKSYDANFGFLGSRNFVHGTSIISGLFEAINEWSLGPAEKIQSNFHTALHSQGRYDLLAARISKVVLGKGYTAIFRVESRQGKFLVGLKERTESVTTSTPYDEDELIKSYEIKTENASATLLISADKPLINAIVALNKKLLLSILPTEGYERWFLARLDLELKKVKLSDAKLLEVQMINSMLAMHAKSSVKLGNQTIGDIYFSRRKT
jgi:hypothetical protein